MTKRLRALQCSQFFVPGLMFVFAILIAPIVLVAICLVSWWPV